MLWWSHLIIWITLHFDVGNTEIVSYCICAFGRGICCKSLYVEASGLNNSRKRQCLVVHIYISIDKIVNSITILLNYFHHLVYIVMVISLTLYVNKWKWKKRNKIVFSFIIVFIHTSFYLKNISLTSNLQFSKQNRKMTLHINDLIQVYSCKINEWHFFQRLSLTTF